ncbi:hypothetical protein JKF63_02718 [Porcisia hertigi]|uniref:Uncharacterized protein n=1 Tax=Porcisia hertigi TaxID=2761500 RepID=A0A836L2M8_9TRYP|nr:hypothetical protein JKF63_02718 [Porcisia hertigi]
MSEEKPKKTQPKRSFLEPLRTDEVPTSVKHRDKSLVGVLDSETPKSTLDWLHFASRLLISTTWNSEAGERVLMMCEEVASMILEEDAKKRASARSMALTAAEAASAEFSPMEGGGAGCIESEGYVTGVDVGTSAAAAAQKNSTSTERVQAAYLLTAAAVAAADVHRLTATETAIRLARGAVEAYRCPMTACTLAMTCVQLGVTSRDPDCRSAVFQTALSIIAAAGKPLLDGETLSKEDAGYVLRMAWMLVGIGASDEAHKHLTAVLQHHPKSYMGLLLLTLLHTAVGSFHDANTAVMHLLSAYPEDVVAVIVHASIHRKCRLPESADERGKDPVAEELAVAMARIAKLSDAAASVEGSHLRKKSLRALCTHCAPDEDVERGPRHSTRELKRRVVGHWALLSHVATRLGCTTVAEVATEAGTDAVAQSKVLYRRTFADLQCSQARLSLIRLRHDIVAQHARHAGDPLFPLVRDANLLGTFDFDTCASDCLGRTFDGLPLSTGVADSISGSSSLFTDPRPHHLLPSRLFNAVASTLLAALEACPNHGEGHMLLGVTRLLEASQRDFPCDTRHNRLQEAGQHFLNAMRVDASIPEAYLGAGVVAEAQGALNESFDFYTSAAEVSGQAPLIPWRYFDYLYQ